MESKEILFDDLRIRLKKSDDNIHIDVTLLEQDKLPVVSPPEEGLHTDCIARLVQQGSTAVVTLIANQPMWVLSATVPVRWEEVVQGAKPSQSRRAFVGVEQRPDIVALALACKANEKRGVQRLVNGTSESAPTDVSLEYYWRIYSGDEPLIKRTYVLAEGGGWCRAEDLFDDLPFYFLAQIEEDGYTVYAEAYDPPAYAYRYLLTCWRETWGVVSGNSPTGRAYYTRSGAEWADWVRKTLLSVNPNEAVFEPSNANPERKLAIFQVDAAHTFEPWEHMSILLKDGWKPIKEIIPPTLVERPSLTPPDSLVFLAREVEKSNIRLEAWSDRTPSILPQYIDANWHPRGYAYVSKGDFPTLASALDQLEDIPFAVQRRSLFHDDFGEYYFFAVQKGSGDLSNRLSVLFKGTPNYWVPVQQLETKLPPIEHEDKSKIFFARIWSGIWVKLLFADKPDVAEEYLPLGCWEPSPDGAVAKVHQSKVDWLYEALRGLRDTDLPVSPHVRCDDEPYYFFTIARSVKDIKVEAPMFTYTKLDNGLRALALDFVWSAEAIDSRVRPLLLSLSCERKADGTIVPLSLVTGADPETAYMYLPLRWKRNEELPNGSTARLRPEHHAWSVMSPFIERVLRDPSVNCLMDNESQHYIVPLTLVGPLADFHYLPFHLATEKKDGSLVPLAAYEKYPSQPTGSHHLEFLVQPVANVEHFLFLQAKDMIEKAKKVFPLFWRRNSEVGDEYVFAKGWKKSYPWLALATERARRLGYPDHFDEARPSGDLLIKRPVLKFRIDGILAKKRQSLADATEVYAGNDVWVPITFLTHSYV